jgi:hypothetical protein
LKINEPVGGIAESKTSASKTVDEAMADLKL